MASIGSRARVVAATARHTGAGVVRHINVPTLRAAWWAARSVHRLRTDLRSDGLEADLAGPPPLPSSAVRGVTATARWMRATCLERSLVLQKWLLAQGRCHTLVIGVPSSGEQPFVAHAWLEGHDHADHGAGYEQLLRVDPR